jgi:RNA polymerase sigma-70 factor (ECF subfamily)
MKKEDFIVISRALKGDQNAYTELLKKYKGAIYSFIFKMIPEKEDAEDMVQETFIKAFSALPTFNNEFAFSTWLFKIASNNCIDYMRKKRLKTYSINKPIESKDGFVIQDLPDPLINPEMEYIESERLSNIESAIQKLPKKYRSIIIMRHKEEKSYEEISAELNIPIGTVKARIFRAREKLKKLLKES